MCCCVLLCFPAGGTVTLDLLTARPQDRLTGQGCGEVPLCGQRIYMRRGCLSYMCMCGYVCWGGCMTLTGYGPWFDLEHQIGRKTPAYTHTLPVCVDKEWAPISPNQTADHLNCSQDHFVVAHTYILGNQTSDSILTPRSFKPPSTVWCLRLLSTALPSPLPPLWLSWGVFTSNPGHSS